MDAMLSGHQSFLDFPPPGAPRKAPAAAGSRSPRVMMPLALRPVMLTVIMGTMLAITLLGHGLHG
jgi:hypothetical protein